MILPDDARRRLVDTQEPMLDETALIIWSLLTALVWSKFNAWAWLALALVPVLYVRVLSASERHADALMATVHVHRFKLYDALQLPLPPSPVAEPGTGERLTRFVREGLDDPGLVYTFEKARAQPVAWARDDD